MHPCQSCGACCAHYRVEFSLADNPQVPEEIYLGGANGKGILKGTEKNHRPACMMLQGSIGKEVGCAIYPLRPNPCREFRASYEDGTKNSRCDEARARHGLRPLEKKDWPKSGE